MLRCGSLISFYFVKFVTAKILIWLLDHFVIYLIGPSIQMYQNLTTGRLEMVGKLPPIRTMD